MAGAGAVDRSGVPSGVFWLDGSEGANADGEGDDDDDDSAAVVSPPGFNFSDTCFRNSATPTANVSNKGPADARNTLAAGPIVTHMVFISGINSPDWYRNTLSLQHRHHYR